jgi:hypothetical protein
MSTSRNKLEEILDQARRLPEDQQRRLVADLQADKNASPSEARRQKALQRWLARAGTGHADVADISSHKNEYLTEIYATKS